MIRILKVDNKDVVSLNTLKDVIDTNLQIWGEKLIMSTQDHRHMQGVYQTLLDIKEILSKVL